MHTQSTFRSPSPSIPRRTYGIAVSSERGRCQDDDVDDDETQQVASGSQTPVKRHPSPPYIDSIPTHQQRQRTASSDVEDALNDAAAHSNGHRGSEDVEMEMHSDVDAALAAAATSSPEAGSSRVLQATSDARTRLSAAPAPRPQEKDVLTPHMQAKFMRKRGMSASGHASPMAAGNHQRGEDADGEIDADADGDADGDAEADADAEIMDAVDALDAALNVES